jgi:hypothetical protein
VVAAFTAMVFIIEIEIIARQEHNCIALSWQLVQMRLNYFVPKLFLEVFTTATIVLDLSEELSQSRLRVMFRQYVSFQ